MSNLDILVTAVNVGGIWAIIRNSAKESVNGEDAMSSAFATFACIGLLALTDLGFAIYYILKG